MPTPTETNTLLTLFKFASLLNTDQSGRRLILRGTIHSQPALLLLERAAFSTSPSYLASLPRLLLHIRNLGDNDIYRWYMANSLPDNALDEPTPPDLKINLIYPATEKHFKKYAFQATRSVVETAEIYERHVRPYMRLCREEGRLNWVFNILEGREEQENVLFRSKELNPKDDYVLLPDLNWDRTTLGSLHLLALVERRDLWSLRDLKRGDVAWLRGFREKVAERVEGMYEGVERDMLKFYVHYQPTYYHFHVHVVHVGLDAGATQAVGKAWGLEGVIAMLENMGDGEERGMKDVEMTYSLGEQSELWTKIFGPLKKGEQPSVG